MRLEVQRMSLIHIYLKSPRRPVERSVMVHGMRHAGATESQVDSFGQNAASLS